MNDPTVLLFDEQASLWDRVLAWFDQNTAVVTWMFVGSIASILLVLALLPLVVVRLPADYFDPVRPSAPPPRSVWGWIGRVLRNVLGWLFVLVGVALLLLPGQGLLTMLIGLMMVDFPGKRGVERRILARPAILRVVNRMRERRGRPPLIVD